MFAVVSLLVIIMLSVIVVRIGSAALELTGLSSEVASFQAQSAFSGVGFTTTESEVIVNHPVRRRIIRILILLGSAGITSSVATLVITFVGQTGVNLAFRGLSLFVGVGTIFFLSKSRLVSHVLKRVIKKALKTWTHVRIYDYEELLGLANDYIISRIVVSTTNWMVDRTLKDLHLEQEGILIISIYRKQSGKEKFIGIASGDVEVRNGDILVCYSRSENAKALARRPQGPDGDKEHNEYVAAEKKRMELQRMETE